MRNTLWQTATRSSALAAIVFVAALSGAPQVMAGTAPSPKHSSVAVPAPFPGVISDSGVVQRAGLLQSGPKTPDMPTCNPIAQGDYAHVSSTPPATASAHGWWRKNNCTVNAAVVTVQLQEFFSDGSWRIQAENVGTITPAPTGSTSPRVTARKTCSGTQLTGWRSVVTANTEPAGERGFGSTTTPAQNIRCRV